MQPREKNNRTKIRPRQNDYKKVNLISDENQQMTKRKVQEI
jgi:hypothetical protein